MIKKVFWEDEKTLKASNKNSHGCNPWKENEDKPNLDGVQLNKKLK